MSYLKTFDVDSERIISATCNMHKLQGLPRADLILVVVVTMVTFVYILDNWLFPLSDVLTGKQ